jgi:hypothetical protein
VRPPVGDTAKQIRPPGSGDVGRRSRRALGGSDAAGGLTQYACAGHAAPCPHGRGFIGDYFGLAISSANVYTLGVWTHDPSTTVTADEDGRVYYQNQVLGIVPRSTFGAGY